MDIECEKCNSKFKIPDEKLPKGQVFSLPCPKCKNKISIDTRSEGASEPAAAPKPAAPPAGPRPDPHKDQNLFDEVASGTYDASEKPFDFVEEGQQTALLCEHDEELRNKIKAAVERMGYSTTEPRTALEALKQMRFHTFDLVILNDRYDAEDPKDNHVLRYLDRLGMAIRRNIFVVLVTERFRTMDSMAAFNQSVNCVINTGSVEEMGKILKRALAENDSFYRVYKESLVRTGRI